jgi:hypothetical protein
VSWREGDDLLRDLAGALSADAALPAAPPPHHLDIFRAAVALHCEPPTRPQPRPVLATRRRVAARRTARVGTIAASLVLVVASAAAAGVRTDGLPLPRPVRAVADAVGLPVDSVALDDTHQHLQQLQEALRAQDHNRASLAVTRLRRDVLHLSEEERRAAEPQVESALAIAAGALSDGSLEPTTPLNGPSPAVSSPVAPPSAPAGTGSNGSAPRPRPDQPATAGVTAGSPPEGTPVTKEVPGAFSADASGPSADGSSDSHDLDVDDPNSAVESSGLESGAIAPQPAPSDAASTDATDAEPESAAAATTP